MLFVDDGIIYKSDNKLDCYELINGTKETDVGIKPQKAGRKPKLNTPYPNYSTVTDFAKFLGWSTSVPLATAVWYANN